MRLLDFVSVKLLLCLIVGIIIGFNFPLRWFYSFGTLCILIPFLLRFKRTSSKTGFPFFDLTTIGATILLGIFITHISHPINLEQHYSNNEQGEVKTWGLKVREVLKPNPYSQRYVAKVISLDHEKSSGKLILNIPIDSTSKKLRIDDELFIVSKAKEFNPPRNPYQFDYKGFLEKKRIHHQLNAKFEDILIKRTASNTLLGIASQFREQIISKLRTKAFGKDEFAVIQALVLGQRNDISEEIGEDYQKAGAIHILAVSGLHVGILLLLLQFLLGPLEYLPKGKQLKLALIILLLWSYAFIAGLSPSIVRAVTMFSFVAYATYLKRPTNAFNIIALSMFFILLVKPLFLFQVGFQMSYAAVLAIVWIYPMLQKLWNPNNFFLRKMWQLLSVSVSAQLGVLPISLFYFHQFPALFFISNLLIVPFLGLILGMGILLIILSFFDALPTFMVSIYNFIIAKMNAVVHWVAQRENFVFKNIPFDEVQLCLAYVVIITLVLFLSNKKSKILFAFLVGMLTFQSWGIWSQFQLHKKETLILAHQTKNTILLHQKGRTLNVFAIDTLGIDAIVTNYSIGERIDSVNYRPLKNSYNINQQKLYVLDSFGIHPSEPKIDMLLLTQSPKIHLERILDSIHPKLVLTDGSNYASFIQQWKKTCLKKEIPFHNTSEKGFYVFELK